MTELNGTDILLRVEKLRKAAGFTREEIAKKIGINTQQFVNWKNRNIVPKADDLYNLSKVLGVPMEYLLTGETIIPDDIAIMNSYMMQIPEEDRKPIIAIVKSQCDYWREKHKNDNK